jgi:heptosyltransferase-2
MKIKQKTLVVFCPNWVGDVVMATPALSCIRHSYPEAQIIGVIRRYARGVIEDGPWFDSIFDFDDKKADGFFKLVKALRKLQPDIAILLRNSFRSALIARLGKAAKIYGYRRDGRSFLLSDGPKPERSSNGFLPLPTVDSYMDLCRFLKLKTDDKSLPHLYFSSKLAEAGNKLLKKYGITPGDMVIGINPGAKFGSSKCWPPEYFAQLAELLETQWKCKIILFAGPGEEEIACTITEKSTASIINTGPDKVDLALLKPLIKRCNLLITNDTGTRHYGVAFDIPLVVIMGPTNPVYTASNLEKSFVLRKDMDCSPCHKRTCPYGHHNCMKMIMPEEALQASIQLLKEVEKA